MLKKIACTSSHIVCAQSRFTKIVLSFVLRKKTNFDAKNKTFYGTYFVFFTPTTCNVVFSPNYTKAYGLWRCTCEIFRLNFLTL
jgi:hypothetical protein